MNADLKSPTLLMITRWSARVLSALLLAFWGFFIIAHLIGDEGRATRPLNWTDYFLLAAMIGWLAGLALAWKWELLGGTLSLVALSPILIRALLAGPRPSLPFVLLALASVLFLISAWLSRRNELPHP